MLPPPSVPWQITGNHWLSIPCIHPLDASIHLLGVVNADARASIEFAGSPGYADGPPLIQLAVWIDDEPQEIGAVGMTWERELSWLPTFSRTFGDLALRGVIFAPCGADADLAGAVISIGLQNRGNTPVRVSVGISGRLGQRHQRIRTTRVLSDSNVARLIDNVVVLEGDGSPAYATLAVCGDEMSATASASPGASWNISREAVIPAKDSLSTAFLIAAGSEPDGALATLGVMRRRGWIPLLASTRAALQKLQQSTSERGADGLINRNLMFAYFTGIARAIDDGRIYPVRSRMPWNGRGLTVSDWEMMMWLLPAIQLADGGLAREVLLRMCELHGHEPGRGVRYMDGTLFEPGFSLEGASSYAIAVDEYIVQTTDDRIVDEPVLAETLYAAHEDVERRKHGKLPLYSTEMNPGGSLPPHPYTVHGNAVAAFALEVFSRTLDEKTAAKVQDAESVRASVLRHFSQEGADGRARFVSATDLDGNSVAADDPSASMYWLPHFHLIGREDSLYRRTVKQLDGSLPNELVARCARLVGPSPSETLDWLRRAALDGGIAAELVDDNGRATGNGGDAALSGLIAYMAWYAVHALGAKL